MRRTAVGGDGATPLCTSADGVEESKAVPALRSVTAVRGGSLLPLQPLTQIEDGEGDDRRDGGELPDGGVLAELDVLIDGDRERGGLARDVAARP